MWGRVRAVAEVIFQVTLSFLTVCASRRVEQNKHWMFKED